MTSTDLARLHAAFMRHAFTERWTHYLTVELGWPDEPEGAGLAYLAARADELAQQIEADPAGAAEWLLDDSQPFGDTIDSALQPEWIIGIYPKHPDARLPFMCLDHSGRRHHALMAQRGEGPASMTAEEISEHDRAVLAQFRKRA